MSTPPGPQDPYGGQTPSYGEQPPGYGNVPPAPPAYGGGGGYQPAGSPPPNHLVWAIISVFLFWPLAIPAIIFSTQVNAKWQAGDAAGAEEASRKAKQFSLWATILGVLSAVLLFVLLVVGGALAARTGATYG